MSEQAHDLKQLAQRIHEIRPFHAAMLMQEANERRQQGQDIISMGIGEPDFPATEPVLKALLNAAQAGQTGYTHSLGIPELREAIARFYNDYHGTNITAERVVVTSGASGALLAATLCALNPGDEMLLSDPAYPGNRNFILAADAKPVLVPCGPEDQYQLTLEKVKVAWGPKTRGVLVASPGNPTSTSMDPEELARIIAFVREKKGLMIVDEIYLGLCFEGPRQSALTLDDEVWVMNSFSKFFQMTGWRLGWMIVPERYVSSVYRLVSNIAICAPTLSQHAAVACFEPQTMTIYEERREQLRERMNFVVSSLESMGIEVPCKPDAAFYVYANVSRFTDDSFAFAQELLDKAGIVVVPGVDFGNHGQQWIRLSYAFSMARLQEAMQRLRNYLSSRA